MIILSETPVLIDVLQNGVIIIKRKGRACKAHPSSISFKSIYNIKYKSNIYKKEIQPDILDIACENT